MLSSRLRRSCSARASSICWSSVRRDASATRSLCRGDEDDGDRRTNLAMGIVVWRGGTTRTCSYLISGLSDTSECVCVWNYTDTYRWWRWSRSLRQRGFDFFHEFFPSSSTQWSSEPSEEISKYGRTTPFLLLFDRWYHRSYHIFLYLCLSVWCSSVVF